MTSSFMTAARSQYLLDLLAQIPDPRNRRGRRHSLAGLVAVGIAGARSCAAIGQWAADAADQPSRTSRPTSDRTSRAAAHRNEGS
jgi:hypothetical protein